MKTLLDGIQVAFAANGTLSSSFANGCEVALAKDAEALPLCVLTVQPPAPPQFQTGIGTPYAEQIVGQFTIYSTDPDFVQSMEADLDATFNGVQFNIGSDYLVLSLRNGGGNPYRDMDGRTWRADYYYKFWVERFN